MKSEEKITALNLTYLGMVFILILTVLPCYQGILYQVFYVHVDSNREKLSKGNNITLTTLNVEPLIDSSFINPVNYSNELVGSALKFYRSKYPKKLIIGHININSINNKFEILKSILLDVLDIFMITETKLDNSFLEQKFHIEGFNNVPSRLYRNRYSGG